MSRTRSGCRGSGSSSSCCWRSRSSSSSTCCSIPLFMLTFLAWFAILFTGRYPKAFFEFTSGVLRWQANRRRLRRAAARRVSAVLVGAGRVSARARDPDAGAAVAVPAVHPRLRGRAELHRALLRPDRLVLHDIYRLVRDPDHGRVSARAVQVQRRRHALVRAHGRLPVPAARRIPAVQHQRRRSARGTKCCRRSSALPLFAAYVAFNLLPFFGLLAAATTTVHVERATLSAAALRREHPSAEANSLRITLAELQRPRRHAAAAPRAAHVGYHLVAFEVRAEKDGFWPTFFTPRSSSLRDCFGNSYVTSRPRSRTSRSGCSGAGGTPRATSTSASPDGRQIPCESLNVLQPPWRRDDSGFQ